VRYSPGDLECFTVTVQGQGSIGNVPCTLCAKKEPVRNRCLSHEATLIDVVTVPITLP